MFSSAFFLEVSNTSGCTGSNHRLPPAFHESMPIAKVRSFLNYIGYSPSSKIGGSAVILIGLIFVGSAGAQTPAASGLSRFISGRVGTVGETYAVQGISVVGTFLK